MMLFDDPLITEGIVCLGLEIVLAKEEIVAAADAPEGGRKDDDKKPRFDLLSYLAMRGTAEVLRFGAQKYAAHNWRKGIAWGRLIGAALRHLTAFMDGEDLDPESGLPHVDHLACCVMFLQEHYHRRRDLDDRFKVRVNISGGPNGQ